MRREEEILADIADAADAIVRSMRDQSFADFLADDDLRDAILLRLIRIGEAARQLPPTLKSRHPNVPWADTIAFRNRAVHAYFAIDWSIVWETATADVPTLQGQIAAIITAQQPPLDPPDGSGRGSR